MIGLDNFDEPRNAVKDVITLLPAIDVTLRQLSDAKGILADECATSDWIMSLRSIAKNSIKSHTIVTSFDKFYNGFLDAWELMTTAICKEQFGFRLPCFYKSEGIEKVIKNILRPVWKMTIDFHYPHESYGVVGTGESTLIGGPVGVGKTTIQVSLFVLLFLLSDVALPVYVEYNTESAASLRQNKPFDVIRRYVQTLGIVTNIQTSSASKQEANNLLLHDISISKKMVIFFSDEIQCLYIKPTTNMSDAEKDIRLAAKDIVFQIATIGKTAKHIGVASGSSQHLQNFALHPGSNGFDDYRTLNTSVYSPFFIVPCREKSAFEKLLEAMKIDIKLESDVIAYFLNSGGVGRKISNSNKDLPAVPNAYHDNPTFRAIVDAMMLRIKHKIACTADNKLHWDPWDAPHGISLAECYNIAECTRPSDVDKNSVITSLVETSLLLPIGGTIELVQPGIVLSAIQFHKMDNRRFEEMAFEGTLAGWSSNDHVQPSAGHCNKEPIRRMLAKELLIPTHPWEVDNNQVLSLYTHVGKLFQGVTNLTGIDGFSISDSWIDEESSSSLLYVTAVQIKTGRLELEIELGSLSKKNSLIHILKGVKDGFCELRAMFPKEEQSRLRLKKVILATTKRFPDEYRTYVENKANLVFEETSFEFELYDQKDVLSKINMSSITIDRLCERANIKLG